MQRRIVRCEISGGRRPASSLKSSVWTLSRPSDVARRRDVAGDVRLLLGRLGRLHLEALDERGVDRAGDHRDERPEADGDHRQPPPALPDVHDQQDRGEERDEEQEVDRRQLRLHVGVAGAVDEAARREGEAVALQPVARALQQGQRREQHRQMGLDLRRHPLARSLQPDAAVQVVGDGRDDDHDDHRREQPVDDEAQERQREDVEADVDAEERVLLPEVDAVGEQDPVVPLARRTDAGDEPEQQRHDDADQARASPDQLLVALDELLLGPGGTEPWCDAIGDPEVDPAEGEEDAGEDQRQRDLRSEHVLEHARRSRARRTRGSRCRTRRARAAT